MFEQRIIVNDPVKYHVFMDRSNEPPAPNTALCKTMQLSERRE
ncbi:hypothetical protein ACFPZP_25585 [Citrobacter bitternis]|uniref:Uncharacterized protein n=1 Tax=Citrobacter bitternis TaxID=1585982 RepID=A0ABW1Q672_9ENTR